MTDFLRSPVSLMILLSMALLSMAGCASSNQSIPDDELGIFMSTQQLDMRVDNRIDNESTPPESRPLAGESAGFTLETPLGDQQRGDSRTLPQDSRLTSDYRIGPHDLLEISVFGIPELDTTARVSASGFITMPLIGLVDAEGLASEELEERIAARLREDYLQDPNVTIFIAEYASQRVTMEGEVGRPGIYSMTGRTSLLQALALAGGLGRLADPETVRVFRENEQGERMVAMFNIEMIRNGKSPDPELKGNDIVVVARNEQRAFLRDSLFRDTIDVLNPFRIIP